MKKLLPLALGLAVTGWPAPAQSGGVGPGRGGIASHRCDVPEPTKRGEDDKIYAPGELDCRAVMLSRPAPEYPRGRRRGEVQGTVRLSVVLLASGKVGEVRAVRGNLPANFTEAAVEAARRIKFRPAVKGDRWVSQRVAVEYNFNTY
jgi:protein TonB